MALLGGVHDHLAHCRVSMYDVSQLRHGEAIADRDTDLVDEFDRVWPHDRGP